MLKLLVALAVVLTPSLALGQSREFTRTVALEPGGELRLDASKGSVQLSAWNRNEVEVRARIEGSDWLGLDTDYVKAAVEATTVDVVGESSSVWVRSNYDRVPSRWNWLGGSSREIPSVHYTIRAPANVNLRLDIDRSDTELTGFEGRLVIALDRSELHARDLRGTIDLTIDRGGRSRLTNLRGTVLLDADRTDVEIDAARLDAASRIRSDRSDIEVRIPSTQPLRVRADLNRRGSFRSDFALERRGRRETLVEGTINGGGPELTVTGDRTSVLLSKRD
jgi:hypothetical protein